MTRGCARWNLNPSSRHANAIPFSVEDFMSAVDVTLVGACGLYCGECEVYVAFSEGDLEKQQEIAESISRQFGADVGPEQIVCGGCRGPEEISFCAGCKIRPCAAARGFTTCAECDESDGCETLGAFLGTDIGKAARRGLEEMLEFGLKEWLRRKGAGHP